MGPLGRCQACLALLMAGLFALCHPATARPRLAVAESWRPAHPVAAGRPRPGGGR